MEGRAVVLGGTGLWWKYPSALFMRFIMASSRRKQHVIATLAMARKRVQCYGVCVSVCVFVCVCVCVCLSQVNLT